MNHRTDILDLSRQQEQQRPEPASSQAPSAEQKPMTADEREPAWALVYRNEHPDYKGPLEDGTEAMMGWAKYGTGLVSLVSITDAELRERAEFTALRTRARR